MSRAKSNPAEAGRLMAAAIEAFINANYPACREATLLIDPGHNLPVLALVIRGGVPNVVLTNEDEARTCHEYARD